MITLKVAEKIALTDRICEFVLVSANGSALPDYTAGAHIDCHTDAGKRSYSLIDWPGEAAPGYRIAVQREDTGDGGSTAMHALAVGDTITIDPPKNDFALTEGAGRVTLLAGGIGVTPLIAMAAHLADADRPFAFHYAGRSAAAMAYLDRVSQVHGASFHAHFDDVAQMDLNAVVAEAVGSDLYICGPKGMIDAAREAAETASIPSDRIHVELFATAAGDNGAGFEVEIASTGQVIAVGADQSIIDALEDAGVDVMYDCQRGDCGICQTDVISGTPDHRDVVLSQAEKDSGKVMQICVSRALSDRLVLDL